MENINGFEIDEASEKRGGMAIVYKGKKAGYFHDSALKMIRPDRVENNGALCNRFIKELDTIGKLNHSNIVRAESAFTYVAPKSGAPYTVLVMEWLDGLDLQEYVDKYGPIINWEQLTKIGTYILEALKYSHSQGILHMDVKPSNVFRTKDGYIKLIDFGIAQVIGEQGENIVGASGYITTVKGESTFRGTKDYASPEQIFGQTLQVQSDIYSFGKTMQFLCTGNTLSKDIANPMWKTIIEKCTQPAIPDRFSSCDEILDYIANANKKECINIKCRKKIDKDARFCPYCGTDQIQTPPPPIKHKRHCPNCGYEENEQDVKKLHNLCPRCNHRLKDGVRTTKLTNLQAVICPICGYFVESSHPALFCPNDGTKLIAGLHCANCGKVTLPNSRFCSHCGHNPKEY